MLMLRVNMQKCSKPIPPPTLHHELGAIHNQTGWVSLWTGVGRVIVLFPGRSVLLIHLILRQSVYESAKACQLSCTTLWYAKHFRCALWLKHETFCIVVTTNVYKYTAQNVQETVRPSNFNNIHNLQQKYCRNTTKCNLMSSN